jgi:RNA polymerase sigma-70 factor (ECF subfamily)
VVALIEHVAGMGSNSDTAALALAGDQDAWNALITQHNHRVVVSLLARGVLIERAKEIAQEAWLKLISQQRLGRLPQLSLPGLAITQAGYLALDDQRSARATREVPLDDATALGVPEGAPDAEARLLGKEQLRQAHAALARMSPGTRRVFELVYENPDLSHADAARRSGLSVQRVRQIICEVRGKLRAVLEEQGRE